MWILTSEVNDYNQHGQYFVGAFHQKPTEKQLRDLGVPEEELAHVLAGGGRQERYEVYWYNLFEYKKGAIYY